MADASLTDVIDGPTLIVVLTTAAIPYRQQDCHGVAVPW
jgi:hypothetical protein